MKLHFNDFRNAKLGFIRSDVYIRFICNIHTAARSRFRLKRVVEGVMVNKARVFVGLFPQIDGVFEVLRKPAF